MHEETCDAAASDIRPWDGKFCSRKAAYKLTIPLAGTKKVTYYYCEEHAKKVKDIFPRAEVEKMEHQKDAAR